MSQPPSLTSSRRSLGTVLRGASVVAAVAALAWWLPRLVGTGWSAAVHAVAAVPLPWLLVLAGVWAVGLAVHTVTLRAALPGLTARRALMLSLTGSAVANVLPVGGAAGIALNHRMTRSWGHDSTAFAAYTIITNVWDVAAKVLLALAGLPLLVLATSAATSVLPTVVSAAGAALGVLVLAAVLLRSGRARRWVGHQVDRVAGSLLTAMGAARSSRPQAWAGDTRRGCASVVRRGWARLTVGILGYTASLAVLFVLCATVAGVTVGAAALAAAFVVERALTLAGLTPGGAGVVEAGLVTVLTAAGGAPVAVLAMVLLYRWFTWGIEIPVGAVGIVGWLASSRRRAARVVA